MKAIGALVVAACLATSVSIALATGPAPSHGPTAARAAKHPLATCFWEGPISTRRETTRGFDGRNFNFPEESATYWLARFDLPEGSRLRLRGARSSGSSGQPKSPR